MADVAVIGERTFLFEKIFKESQLDALFISPGILGSPFLPKIKMIIVPAGFANPEYSDILPALIRSRSNIATFVENGGVLTVFGPLVPKHMYDWLPLHIEYIHEYFTSDLSAASDDECSCLVSQESAYCDGYLLPGKDLNPVFTDSKGRAVLVSGNYGRGVLVITSIHEFPQSKYLRWGAEKGMPARI